MSEYKDYGFENDGHCHAHGYLLKKVLLLLSKSQNNIILDVGCGNGALVRYLLSKGLDAYGTDASEKGITIANNLNPNRFAVQDLSKDNLPPAMEDVKFKTIVSTEVVEHLYDPRGFVAFIKRILLKNGGGDVIISTPYHGYLKNLLLSVFNKWDKHANPLWNGGHIKLWSKKTLTQLLEEQGFVIQNFCGCGRLPYLWKSMIIKARIDG